MQKILVSRCLLGEPVRYDGGSHGPFALLETWRQQGRLVAVCPEVAGGLSTPRVPAEIPGGQGARVLDGESGVITRAGEDVAAAFRAGAETALALVRRHGIRLAVLKARSPSCGHHETYDGSFSGRRVPGEGVTAALLRRHGVQLFSEEELEAAAAALASLEG